MSSKNFYGLTGDVTVDGGILNVGNAQLYANTETSNVGVGTSNPEFQLDVHGDANVGVLYSTFLHGDGSNIQNIVSSQWEGSPGDPIYYASNVGIANTSPVTTTMQIGSNVVIDDVGSNVIHVTGNIYADYLVGDGSQLTGIAASLDQIVDQGNTVSNTIQIEAGQDATSNIGLVTHEGVGISVSNANPTGEYQFGVGSNLLVNVYSSNVLTVDGNVFAQKMTLGTVTVTPAYNLQQIMTAGATSDQTLILSNATTGLTTTSNVGIANTAPVHTLDVGSNLYVEDTGSNVLTVTGNAYISGDVNIGSNLYVEDTGSNVLTVTGNAYVTERLDVGSNVHIENLRVAEVAANLVTYDSATGELMDSAGLFSNKLAVVSEQPPVALTGASTVVAKHGTYTIEASSGTVVNLFDKVIGEINKWETDGNYSTDEGTEGDYNGSASLAGYDGEWVKITMPYKTILRHVKIESTNQSVEDIKLVGLNSDGLTWSVLKTVTGLTGTTHTIIVNATTHHKTYGLIVEKTNTTTGRSAVEIGDLKLFTESFSIDGGKVEMATSMVMGGETTMDQHGPHGRDGAAVLKKYPEIVFESGKFDRNDSTSPEYFIQAGYKVTASGSFQDLYYPWRAFDGLHNHPSGQTGWYSRNVGGNYNPSYNGSPVINLGTASGGTATVNGEYLTLEIPNKICLKRYTLYGPNQEVEFPADWTLYGSNDGTSWESIDSQTGQVIGSGTSNTGGSATGQSKSYSIVNTTQYDRYAIVVTKINSSGYYYFGLQGLEIYGYEEDPPAGDTSVDTTFSSIMNTPQTTGANVYTDAKLSSDFTNQVTGPTPVGTAAVHDNTNKYWEMNGQLTSNITVEANTFLEGDQPHAVSVWFNSSNLEANVSNTCVFSISDQEKLDSVNLDLQSNTWHNLTYAYQGEGGSRVTYLDGRKVAEDQAEDTFGEYPPFAMTGYSQGGYVLSVDADHDGTNKIWKAFDGDDSPSSVWFSQPGSGDADSSYQAGYARGNAGQSVTDTDGTTHSGSWGKIEFPYKFVLNYVRVHGGTPVSSYWPHNPDNYVILGSNDDTNWDLLTTRTGANDGINGMTAGGTNIDQHPVNATKAYKYIKFLVTKLGSTSGDREFIIASLKLYGHRENDLVRLPDPTNVLKYPHIAMTGPAQRGYVASASSEHSNSTFDGYNGIQEGKLFDDDPATFWHAETDDGTNNQRYNGTDDLYTGINSLGGVSGEWLKLQLPHKIILSKVHLRARSGYETQAPEDFSIIGSNNDSTWYPIQSFTGESPQDDGTSYYNITSNPSEYNYLAIVIQRLVGSSAASLATLEFYGTGVDSVPIQIGGGNIDKVANFRVYDKFIDQNQALEIWDAQKDLFREVKNSMTLQKGRLGIGTTEPEGRLAVADEPHNLEEFPPRAMTGYKNYFEGHGEFCASGSSYYGTNIGRYQPYAVFDRQNYSDAWEPITWNSIANSYNASTRLVSSGASLGGYSGEWLKLSLPYGVKISGYQLAIRSGWSNYGPDDWVIIGSNDDKNWVLVSSVNAGNITPSASGDALAFKYFIVETTKHYKHLALVCSKIAGGVTNVNIAEWKLFGTREQGQSVLHDGQLTLTKSLNVPRIGPALDADDTPRRDRLVVEYNTSTNPTFEGAVRDTSGRGLDGFMYGNTYYDATTKDVTFDGLGADHIERKNIGFSGEQLVSVSIWFRYNSIPTSRSDIFAVGKSGTATQFGIATYTAGTYLYTGGNDIYNTGYNLITDTSWHHIVAIYRGGTPSTTTMSLYLDNVDVTGNLNFSTASQSVNFDPNDCDLVIGSTIDTVADVNGSISNFKLYDTALTAEEVKRLYDMGRCDEGHHVVNFSKTRVGIGLGDGEAPRGALDVRGETPFIGPGLVIHQAASGNWGTQGDPANMNGLLLTLEGETGLTTGSSYWNIAAQAPGNSSLLFAHRGKATAFIDINNSGNSLDFTGQHRTFIKDVPFSQAGDLEGLIVSSDQNKYIKISGGIETGSNAIMINESLPVVSLSTTTNDKKCFGVISASEDPEQRSDAYGSFVTPFDKEKGDTRVYINSVGEGAIWVVNTNGSLESGDYITTSNVAGYGQKQTDDVLHNYTVAKITMDCDFEPATQPVQQILRSNVIQTYYLGNVHKVKTVPHEFVTTTVGADDAWSNVSVSPSDVTYAEWSNLEANTQNTYTLTYTQTSNVVYDTKYTLTTTANVTESDPWDRVFVDPPNVTYAEYSNLEANTQSSYSLTFTKTTTDEKTPEEWSALESNTQSLYNKVYYQSVEEEVASDYPGATTHTRVTDRIENELDAHGQIQWEDHATETEKAYKIRYLDVSGAQTDEANAVHIAAFVGCTYHCG